MGLNETTKFQEGDDVWFYTSEEGDTKIRCTVEEIGICNDFVNLESHEGDKITTFDFDRVEKIDNESD